MAGGKGAEIHPKRFSQAAMADFVKLLEERLLPAAGRSECRWAHQGATVVDAREVDSFAGRLGAGRATAAYENHFLGGFQPLFLLPWLTGCS